MLNRSGLRHRARGVLALPAVLVLLLVAAAAVVGTHQVLRQDHRATARGLRAGVAAQQADSALAVAIAALHDPRPVDAQCRPADDGTPLRVRALTTAVDGLLVPVAQWQVRCRWQEGAPDCHCGPTADLEAEASPDAPWFSWRLAADGHDPRLLQVQATGCAGGGCEGREEGAAEGRARRQAVLRPMPLLRLWVDAALTVGQDATLGSGLQLQHDAASGSGVVLVAGGTVAGATDAALRSRPGTPGAQAVAAGDTTLAALAASGAGSGWSHRFLGGSAAALGRWPQVQALDAEASAAGRGDAAAAAQRAGWRVFVSPGDLELPGGEHGTPEDPLLIVVDGSLSCRAGCRVTGAVIGTGDAWVAPVSGPMSIEGAVLQRGQYRHGGRTAIRYDADILRAVRQRSQSLWPVPGRWSDL